ncbi:MAG: DMT family transporter [Gammaproteobacteria bacterium]|nr:DMT family transporter [Gammaproteobacteria bacterium]
MPYEMAALLAAFCWTIGGLISTSPARAIGGMSFTRIRMTLVFFLLVFVSYLTGGWQTIAESQLPIIILSGLIGIFIGDTALFTTMSRLGPRRTAMLFATNAPMSAIIGYFWFGERMTALAVFGCSLVMSGVIISIRYGKRADQVHHFETIRGSLAVGLALGLLAALGQSIGSVIVKPALSAGADPLSVAAIRTGVAAAALWTLQTLFPVKLFRRHGSLTPRLWLHVIASGIIGMAIGMTLLLYAFAHGDVGVASILSSTNPIMLLPMIWLVSGEKPANGAWVGALLAVLGTSLILAF